MKILCFGSINFDYIYQVDHFVEAGETMPCIQLDIASGGKGLNQAVAASNAGANTYFAGSVGSDGLELIDTLIRYGVNTDFAVVNKDVKTGHAIIQNNAQGDNCILAYKGANGAITTNMIDGTIEKFEAGDYLLVQNEINNMDKVVECAHKKGMIVVLNPSPILPNIHKLSNEIIDYIVLNEVEACQLTGLNINDIKNSIFKDETKKLLIDALKDKYPKTKIILTLGEHGSVYYYKKEYFAQMAYKVKAVDTTAAGDTFMGYFIAKLSLGYSVKEAMDVASKASSIAVTKLGAAPSIPKNL